ncbi:MAG TPA: DNA polymerase III subunit gamma/tau [Candidatus Dormibacteraeota bacterium]|nr:DNA polymerase III subunit gamma/tau [Candidatus Dormibacteraeota bacterium]
MSYQVIARKWRPQTFADLVGQQHVTDTLKNAITNNRVAHAYIFSGARGVGKTTAARILAKALNCVNGPTAEPCGVCDSCKEIAAGTSLDVIEIDAASNRGIDQIRELREMVRYAPAASRSKVVILDEAHMLTGEASNALLKTLEEPPDQVIFVMATTEPENLADTIRSRSQHFHFRALTFAEITGRLQEIGAKENLKIEAGALAVLARMAEGSLRDALSLLEQARAYCGDAISDKDVRELLGVVPEDALEEMIGAIAEGSADRALSLVHSFQKEGRNLQHFCREAIRHVRNLLIARVCGAESDLIAATPDQRPALARAAAQFSEEDLTRFFQILLQTDDDLRRKPDPRIHLEMGLLRLINAARLAPLEELMAEMKNGGAGGSAPPASGTRGSSAAPAVRGAAAGTSAANASAGASSVSPAMMRSQTSVAPSVAASFDAVVEKSNGTVRAAAPAVRSTEMNAAVGEPAQGSPKTNGRAVQANGITLEQVTEIKTAIQAQQKFVAELIEHASRWELEGAELRLCFSPDKQTFAGLLDGRDTLEKIRAASSKVLGRSVRVCAKIESVAAVAAAGSAGGSSTQELRERFERDPMVRSMLQRFGGKITEVRRRQEES